MPEVFDLLKDPMQLRNLAGDPTSEFGQLAAAQMLPLAMALSKCSHEDCWKPTPAAVPPIAPNGSHLQCYADQQTPTNPNAPTGNLGKVDADHHFQGWACMPNKPQAEAVVPILIKIDGEPAMELHANISRPGLRGKTPCLGTAEAHGFAGVVPQKYLAGKHVMSAFAMNPGLGPPAACAARLAKDGCEARGKEACIACAERHQADLEAAGCTNSGVEGFCGGSPPAPPVLIGQDSLCNGVSCGPDEEGHAWHAFEAERRAWNAEQSARALL